MHQIDWVVLFVFFLFMVIIGFWTYRKVKISGDYFVAGGKLPWWLSGISHHMSGYSGVVYVAFAGIAYTHGITIYVWWALTIFIGVMVGSFIIAPRWSRLRTRFSIQSPTEYLTTRYNLPTQQIIAWSGVLLKVFDVGAKWVAIAILINVFTGLSLVAGILLAGVISLIYITLGGLWAVVWTDFVQFLVQIVAGAILFFSVIMALGGMGALFSVWEQLPEAHSQPFHSPYTAGFALAFLFINFLSYNGGTWNLATRYISSSSGSEARKAALLSGALYLVWPFVIFFPMIAAPLILPELDDPTQVYALMTMEFLGPGLVGLVLASLFASTMSMISSDANTIAAVITRDILPNLSNAFARLKESLFMARMTTFLFTAATIVIAIYADSFGGVVGLIIYWFGALIGPAAIPMLFGMLPAFRHCDSKSAIIAIVGGVIGFIVVNYGMDTTEAVKVATPVTTAFVLFVLSGWLNRRKPVKPEVDDLIQQLKPDVKQLIKNLKQKQA